MKSFHISQFPGITIGQCENADAGTGCTVLACPAGMAAGVDVRGGGPAAREIQLLDPLASAQAIHAIVLSGGSAFGLNCAGGVMNFLEECGIGYDVGITKVPLVCQSSLFDLQLGDPFVRPDEIMGYQAAKNAINMPNYTDGNYGAGCGATVGKLNGMQYCMKSGIGSFAVQYRDLMVGAVVAVNAFGDVYDWKNGQKVAGTLKNDLTSFADTDEVFYGNIDADANRFTSNTTIGVVITNAEFNKASLCKIAGMAQDGLARTIRPIHTSADGDTLYAVSTGTVPANQDVVGALAADVVCEAILTAVRKADAAYGYPSISQLQRDSF